MSQMDPQSPSLAVPLRSLSPGALRWKVSIQDPFMVCDGELVSAQMFLWTHSCLK